MWSALYELEEVAAHYDQRRFAGWRGGLSDGLDALALRRALAAFVPGGHLLDLACGTGRMLPRLLTQGFRCTGLDRSAAMLSQAQQRLKQLSLSSQIELVRGSFEQLPFPDQSFDGALALRLLGHLSADERLSLWPELRRVCRGPVLVEICRPRPWDSLRLRPLDDDGGHPWRTFHKEELTLELWLAGYRILTERAKLSFLSGSRYTLLAPIFSPPPRQKQRTSPAIREDTGLPPGPLPAPDDHSLPLFSSPGSSSSSAISSSPAPFGPSPSVLMINKFYWPFGGVEHYLFGLSELLRQRGYTIYPFALQHPQNLPASTAEYFLRPLDLGRQDGAYRLAHLGRIISRTLYSPEASRRLSALLDQHRPQLAHLHLYHHHLSPSILPPLFARGIPIIQTIHDYQLLCSNYRLYCWQRQEYCEDCLKGSHWPGLWRRCTKGSLAGSALAVLAAYLHRWTGLDRRFVSLWLAPSHFVRQKLLQGGLPPDKIALLPNTSFDPLLLHTPPSPHQRRYLLYLGRLAPEKGVGLLLEAARLCPQIPLYLAGDGPDRPRLVEQCRKLGLSQVRFLGPVSPAQRLSLLDQASALVLPSLCPDIAPTVVIEAAFRQRPTLASAVGGIPEQIIPEQTGLLVPPAHVQALAQGMQRLWNSPTKTAKMGRQAAEYARQAFHPSRHLEQLLSLYQNLLAT